MTPTARWAQVADAVGDEPIGVADRVALGHQRSLGQALHRRHRHTVLDGLAQPSRRRRGRCHRRCLLGIPARGRAAGTRRCRCGWWCRRARGRRRAATNRRGPRKRRRRLHRRRGRRRSSSSWWVSLSWAGWADPCRYVTYQTLKPAAEPRNGVVPTRGFSDLVLYCDSNDRKQTETESTEQKNFPCDSAHTVATDGNPR
jgi:hypothetical protein